MGKCSWNVVKLPIITMCGGGKGQYLFLCNGKVQECLVKAFKTLKEQR
jgi:hypothetical protein